MHRMKLSNSEARSTMTAAQIPDRSVLLDIYRRATAVKQNDERFRAVIKSGKVTATYYSPRGQDLIPSAVSACLTDRDYICTIYRGIHDMIARGIPLKLLWAEIAGKATGTCKGKGGAMHITHPASGIMVTTGVVGSSMPIANGLALASQIRNEKRVTVAYFGDGASNIGAFHEALNMAAVWKLPVVFVCQNNQYGEHTRYAKTTGSPRVADRAASYGMPGLHVDGNDPIAMYRAGSEAIARAKSGGGPTLIEAMTFRFMGHVYGDDDAYMDPAEKTAAMEADPVPRFRAKLLADSIASEASLKIIEDAIEAALDEAVEFAVASPFPPVGELTLDIYQHEVAA